MTTTLITMASMTLYWMAAFAALGTGGAAADGKTGLAKSGFYATVVLFALAATLQIVGAVQ